MSSSPAKRHCCRDTRGRTPNVVLRFHIFRIRKDKWRLAQLGDRETELCCKSIDKHMQRSVRRIQQKCYQLGASSPKRLHLDAVRLIPERGFLDDCLQIGQISLVMLRAGLGMRRCVVHQERAPPGHHRNRKIN